MHLRILGLFKQDIDPLSESGFYSLHLYFKELLALFYFVVRYDGCGCRIGKSCRRKLAGVWLVDEYEIVVRLNMVGVSSELEFSG